MTRNDVARLAGVAPSTVSYVINNGPRPVSLEARERVLKAIDDLGYHPSDVARSLRTRRTLTIGLVNPDITNPFYGEMVQAVEAVTAIEKRHDGQAAAKQFVGRRSRSGWRA